jgi:hypothetical protein
MKSRLLEATVDDFNHEKDKLLEELNDANKTSKAQS